MNKQSSSVAITTNKSSRNYLPDNDDEEERRVKKKARILSSMTGMVLQLAEVGIVKHNLGDYESAEQYFSQALSCVDSHCYLLSSRNSGQFFGGKPVKMNTHIQKEQLVYYSANELSLPHHQVSPSGSVSLSCSTTTTNVATTTTNAAESRIEYDEGMHVYKTILQINPSQSQSQYLMDPDEEAIIPAILCYNIAHTYVQRKLYDVATTWFLQSLDRFAIMHALPRMNNNDDINDGDATSSTLRIVMSLNCLGYCHYRLGNFRQAKVFYQRALFMISSSPSSGLLRTSIHMAAAINCVAVVLLNEESFDTNKTMEMFKESIEIYSKCLLQEEEEEEKGSSNMSSSTTDYLMLSIATVLNNLGRIMFIRSEFIDAVRSYEESLKLRRELLGRNSVDVAATTYNIGQTYQQLNRNDEALKLFEEFLNTVTSVETAAEHADDGGGPAWKDTVLVYKGMAEIYQQKSDYSTALKYFKLVLKVQRRLVDAGDDDDPNATTADIACTLNKMGSLCYEMKNYKEALIYYEEGLKLEKSILAPNHQHIIITLTNIGHIYKHLGDYKKALDVYQLIDPMQKIPSSTSETKNGGEDNFDSLARAETMSSIGLMQYHLAEYDESFNSYQEALRIRRQHYHGNDDHSDIASTLNSIGLVLFKQYVYDLAKQCFNESLRIRSKLFGTDHRDVATLWYNIATIHFETGEDDLAIQMYKETLRVERISLGNDHPDVVLTLQHLGQVYQQVGQAEESLKYFQEAVAIERRRRHQSDATVENSDDDNNNNIQLSLARNLNLLGNLYLQLGMTTEMMECYVESSRIYEAYRSTSSDPEPGTTVIIRGYNLYCLSKSNPPCAPKA